MKEIKAYIPQHRIADVLQALRDSGLCDARAGTGCHNLAVARVERPMAGADPALQHYSMELAEPVVAQFKLEVVCADDLTVPLTDAISKAAHTGQPEAGWIFVSEIQTAVEIR